MLGGPRSNSTGWSREHHQYILTHPPNLRSLVRLAAARAVTLPGLLQVRAFCEMLPVETVD